MRMAPSVAFHSQPFGKAQSAGSILKAMLDDDGLTAITIAVAWVRFRGLLRLKQNVEAFRDRGGSLCAVVGIDEGGATRPGLLGIMRMADEAYVFKDSRGGTFHPKVYLGEGREKAELLVGSSNLTPGGLFVNVEASTSAVFGLPAERNHPALLDARRFVADLIDDGAACTRLTPTTVDELCANKSYRIALNERSRSRTGARPRGADPADIDETVAGADTDETGPLFPPSRRRRTRIPPLTQTDRDELAALELDDLQEPGQPAAPGLPERGMPPGAPASPVPPMPSHALTSPGAPSVTEVWTKEMERSDAQQVSARSNPTGLLRLTKEDHDIDHLTWFRQTLFRAPVVWGHAVDRRGNPIEVASASFNVRIEGVDYGTFVLKVDYGPHRESKQGNVPTLIHWGRELGAVLRAHDHSGQTLTLERFANGSYRLTIG
jgi:hypothetical protein